MAGEADPPKPYQHKMAKIYPRIDWSGQATYPKNEVPMVHPIKKVMFHFNTDVDVCTSWIDCIHTMQVLQKRHLLEGSDDIKFNFLIGGDGQAYEGRGYDFKPCPSLRSLITYPWPIKGEEDWERMDVAIIGRYESYDDVPVPVQLGMYDVVELGVRKGIVDEFYSYYEIRNEEPPLEIPGYRADVPATIDAEY
ncbi:peptidoglycan-recognition protein 2-like [Macrosteles quadrilineatus]|uniref:peptidoglycan-recognition protein 2-like n=1 Tax=Macrosteles quadrilineatus TaxID=74068 RepID=UPI0023E0DBB0|nr:peptidoglycan-recognition protein 2-like [Macrosteles quadrilineatus]